ncbi:AWPM-19-like family protein [Klebsormidium nitens]|uniref:AWPM-19-like family protein n=1 Tax=Klebsormidium nitens TaxID=105231 RepID=A0A1Y1IF24_KLENI|nr:AWPM-19-like family protein [Klebsormidium nitens]|eukprot:GAQ88602.1 AWPM-19-like family protein [Klebsormidium nitens]
MANRSDTGIICAVALLNGLLIATNVGMLSYVVNNILDHTPNLRLVKPNARPNAATQYLLIFTASAVLIGATSVFLGFITSARRNNSIRAAAFSLSLASIILYALSIGFGAKQTQLGGEGSVPKAIFALDVVLVVTGTLYAILLYMGLIHDGHAGLGTGTAPAGAPHYGGDYKV